MPPPDLELDLLRTFVHAADLGSFTRAAGALHLTQSAVSQQIQRLEQRAGTQLFERGGRSIEITEAGQVLLGYARQILALSEDASTRLRGCSQRGTVRLGVTEHVIDAFPPVLGRFARAHPRIRLSVEVGTSSSLVQRTREGKLDLALALLHSPDDRAVPLAHEELVWAGSRDYDLADEDPLPLVVFGSTCRLRKLAVAQLDLAQQRWRVAVTSSSLAGVRAAVAAGLGVAVMLRRSVTPELCAFDATPRLPELPALELNLFRSPRPQRPAAGLLDAFLRDDLVA